MNLKSFKRRLILLPVVVQHRPSYMRHLRTILPFPLLVLLLLLATVNTHASSRAILTSPYDVPLRKDITDLGPSSSNPPGERRIRITLSCYLFPKFMVKEYDEGEKGAAWIGMVLTPTPVSSACGTSHVAGEKVIGADEWCGYFRGAKQNLVFLVACDGANGGLPFAVYDARTGKKIFEDSAYDSSMWKDAPTLSHFDRLQVLGGKDQPLILRYLRVIRADCDLHSKDASCWGKVAAELHLHENGPPVCRGYENIPDRTDSVLAYPVEISLSTEPSPKNVSGPVLCWPFE